MRTCSKCLRLNPVGFLFCGFCAAPMEATNSRAKVAEVSAPKGGWPNLDREMTEVRFFLEQGQLDEAYELLSVLQRRYPGHPALADSERSGRRIKADTSVHNVVDDVLASSSTLAGKAPRRRATTWDAPRLAKKKNPTDKNMRSDIAEVLAVEGEVSDDGAVPLDLTHEARPIREKTMVYSSVAPKPSRSGMTIAVDALQPAAPYASVLEELAGPAEPSETEETKPRNGKKAKAKTKSKPKRKASPTARKRKLDQVAKKKAPAFGAGVLGRFGR